MKITTRELSRSTRVTTFALESMGNRAYVIENSNRAVLIDPPLASWAIEIYLEQRKLRVSALLDTHIHNDFVSGSPGLAEKYSAPHFAPVFKDRKVLGALPILEGRQIEFDGFDLMPVHTPGHTMDHHAFVLNSESSSKAALFSGGSWLQGGLGRVDLDQKASAKELARLQVLSLEKMLGIVENDTLLMPTHGFGSYCSYGSVTVNGDTVADDKARNPYIGNRDAEKLLLSNPLPVPPHFKKMATINREASRRNEIADFREYFTLHLSSDLSFAVDSRTRKSRLINGTLGLRVLGTDGPFPVWFGWLGSIAGSDRFVVDSLEDAELLTEGLVSTGEPPPEAYILAENNIKESLVPANYREQEVASLDVSKMGNHVLIDLRHRGEWLMGHLKGSRNMPFEDYIQLPEELSERHVAVYCGSGYRASIFLANVTKSHVDRVAVDGSVTATFSGSAQWCTLLHEGSNCES